jgi:hypothetical protein
VATIAAALRAESAAAAAIAPPASMLSSTVNVALLSTTGGAGVSAPAASASLSIAEGVTKMFALAKLKAAAVAALAFTAVGGVAVTGTVYAIIAAAPPPQTAFTTTTTVLNATNAAAHNDPKFTTEVDANTKVEFLGVSKFPPTEESWHSIAGQPIDPPIFPTEDVVVRGERPEYQCVVLVTRPRGTVVQIQWPDGNMVTNNNSTNADADQQVVETFLISSFTLHDARKVTGLKLGFASKAWTALGAYDRPDEDGGIDTEKFGRFSFAALRDDDRGRAVLEAVHADSKEPLRVVAIDAEGKEHESNSVNLDGDGNTCTATYAYDIPSEKVKKLVAQARPFSKVLEVKELSLSPENPTEPKITVTDKE